MFNWLRSKLFRRSLENPSTPFGRFSPPNSLAGIGIDEQTCLNHLPVFAAVNCISSDMALLDPQVIERQGDGSTRIALDHELEYLLSVSPNDEITSDRWRQAMFGHVLTWGNSYNEIEYDPATWRIKAFWLLDPSRMTVERDYEGTIVYKYRPERGEAVALPAWKVLHFAGLGFDGLKGYSPIRLARETLGLGMAADRFGAAFFGNAARPAGMLKTNKTLSDTAAKRLRQDFENLFSGAYNAGRVIVGEEGLDFVSMSIPPDDAQFLETRKMSVEDVARLYSIPAHKIGGAAPSGSIEEQNIDYLQSTLLGLCNMFEGELAFKCLKADRSRYKITHDFKKLLKANAAARAQYNATAIQWGWATRNRIAQEEGFEPYKGGEAPLLPLNMVMIGPDGQPLPNPVPPQPATPTTTATDSSATVVTALAGMVRSLIDAQAKPVDSSAVAAVQDVARAELQRALRREAAAITRAAGKPNFRNAVETLCDEHKSYLVESLGPCFKALNAVGIKADAERFAAEWCERSKADLVGLESVTLAEQRPAAVAELMERWTCRIESSLAASGEIVVTAWTKNDAI